MTAYTSNVLGRHVADMKPRGKVHRWMRIMGLVSGVTLIIGFFIELLVFGRWNPSLAVSGTAFTTVFAYQLFSERRRLRVPPPA
jgi:ABC-type multidrug transport system permease subunit